MTTQKDGSVLYAVYGTLREGFGNNRLFQEEGVELLGTINTKPEYTMYSLGGFPGVAEGGDTSIVVEIYKVTNPRVCSRVNSLEGYTGTRGDERNWYDTCEIETEWGTANMFTMNGLLNSKSERIVKSGDWTNKTY